MSKTINYAGNYTCACGRNFTNPQSFNGHKRHCETHLENTGKLESILIADKLCGINSSKTAKDRIAKRKSIELSEWIAEEHKCEKCGSTMLSRYGSGRFCSRSCANSKSRDIICDDERKQSLIDKYLLNPKKCTWCDSIIPYSKRCRKTCSEKCLHEVRVNNSVEYIKNNGLHNTVCGKFKKGMYKNFYCDSSWELAFIIYCLDNNIKIERNRKGFEYEFENSKHMFYPDFIVDGVFYEIKGFFDRKLNDKLKYFPSNENIVILYRKDIRKYIDYCENVYGKNFIDILYEQQNI